MTPVSHGKPYAGNPHVRFEEGASAPANPRRKALLHNNDENWENEIDWSKRTTVVGGTDFYEFVKDKAIPVLDDGIRQLEAAKARCEDKMRRWGGIAERRESSPTASRR